MVKKINEAQFEDVKKDDIAVVDFSAVWCGPCKMLAPVLDAVSETLDEQVSFYNVDVDESQALATQFGIMSVPSLLLFKKGVLADQRVGFLPPDAVMDWVRSHLD